MAKFESKSPEAEASLWNFMEFHGISWNFMVDFDGSGACPILFHSLFSDCDIAG
jgi:hypothetical protein